MSDLVVMSFNSVEAAEAVRDTVRQLEKSGMITLSDAAVISKDADGKINVSSEVSRETKVGAPASAPCWGPCWLCLSHRRHCAGHGGRRGCRRAGRQRRGSQVCRRRAKFCSRPASASAFFLVIRSGDAAVGCGALEPHQGTLIQTTLDTSLEEQLRDALK